MFQQQRNIFNGYDKGRISPLNNRNYLAGNLNTFLSDELNNAKTEYLVNSNIPWLLIVLRRV